MKTELTTEQSQHLIELGVPPPNSEICIHRPFPHHKLVDTYKVFKLEDLLEILPKEIAGEEYVEYLRIGYTTDRKWQCYYTCFEDYFYGTELINSLYELCVWCLTNNYIKL